MMATGDGSWFLTHFADLNMIGKSKYIGLSSNRVLASCDAAPVTPAKRTIPGSVKGKITPDKQFYVARSI